jgi:sugar lactone lactonase YvrE
MLNFDDEPAIALVKTAPKGAPRRCRVAVVGTDLITETGPVGKAPKVATKPYASAHDARRAWDKAVRDKLRDDFAFVRPYGETPLGGVMLVAFASGAGAGTLLDLSPDGRFAVTLGSDAKLAGYHVEVIEVATGARRRVLEHTNPATQNFVMAAFFNATGGAVYLAPRDETLRLDLATGATTRVAGYRESIDARFNPFVVQPHTDRDRGRVVVFDAGTHVRVLDRDDRVLFSACLASSTTECRAARISPSGHLLALYRVSRGIAYGHEDATHDDTSVVEVWDVDTGALRASLPMPTQVDAVGFTPDDATLLVTEYYARGPVAYDLATGEERWRLNDPHRPGELASCHTWAYSPDGSLLAVGHSATGLYEAATRAPVPLDPAGMYRTPWVRFSDDGRLLASAEGGLCVVRRVR